MYVFNASSGVNDLDGGNKGGISKVDNGDSGKKSDLETNTEFICST